MTVMAINVGARNSQAIQVLDLKGLSPPGANDSSVESARGRHSDDPVLVCGQ